MAAPATTIPPLPTLPPNLSDRLDLHISLTLWSWPALTFACANAFGGSPEISAAKREWLAGAVSELLTSSPPQIHDADDLEEVLVQVMNDEFELVIDDDSAGETAREIWKGCELLQSGDTAALEGRYARYLEKQRSGQKEGEGMKFVRRPDEEGVETDGESEDEEFNGFSDDEDMQMGDAPGVVAAAKKEKVAPEVDEDGFTKVVGKKKR